MKHELLPKTFEGKLWRLAEECSEVIKECSKIARFTIHCPQDYVSTKDNKKALLEEISDLEHAIAAIKDAMKEKHTETCECYECWQAMETRG